LTDFFYEPIHACTKPYPETAEVLESLKSRGMRLAIITNAPWDTPARLLRSDLEQWGFADYFEAFICSGNVPWRKPNPKFMFAAADALGVLKEECLVVGDTFDKDIVGAANAGMMSVWINRDGAGAPVEGLQPTWIVTSLSQFWELECWT
jgi:putative hydrolase of the HAD superfamily